MARFEPSDQQWQKIEPLLPPERSGRRGRPYVPHRPIVNGILWVLTTGARWADMPPRYGPWQTAYDRFVRWRKRGIWSDILTRLQAYQDECGRLEWHFGAADSTIVAAHPIAATVGHYSEADLKKGAANPTSQQPRRRKMKLLDAAEVARRPRSISSRTVTAGP
jgi:transposase